VTAVQPQWTAPPEPTAEQLQKREERKIEREKERAEELKISTSGGYWESVQYRASLFAEKVPETGAFKLFTLSMFMIGFWFVRSGAITSPGQNAALFSRLAKTMLPLGLAMTLTSVMLRSHFEFKAGVRPDTATMYAAILFQWGALPLCIGYVAAMVCALRSQVGVRLLSPFRHAGRMALSNYIAASIVGTWFFYGYGLGFWGEVPRAGQVLFVAVVFAAQMWLSYFWLRHFRYGPLEWAWRAFTYWTLPPMRRQLSTREPEAALAPPVPAG
ncbi:MAG TPA: DUF418 domain-containing protein, partial [Arenimonas sp.]|nr:DUF418 domain-containing protein [Arenimonas sp.]